MNSRLCNSLAVFTALWMLTGCATSATKNDPKSAHPNKLSIDDLDQLTCVYADRYMTLISSACDQIANDNPSAQQRLTAAQVKVINCSSVFDIATAPDAFSRL